MDTAGPTQSPLPAAHANSPETPVTSGEIEFGWYVAGLIDVLNQRERLAAWNDFEGIRRLDKHCVHAIKDTVGTIVALRDMGRQYIEQFNRSSTIPTELAQRYPERVAVAQELATSHVQSHTFSDTTVFFAPTANGRGRVHTKTVAGIFFGLAALHLTALAGKIATRGGIDVGIGCNAFPGEVYGPCLANAYQLESKVAGHPRIVVGSAACEFLREQGRPSSDDPVDVASASVAAWAGGFLFVDSDGKTCLDFAGSQMADTARGIPELRHVFKPAFQFASDSLQRFRATKNEKLAERYRLLFDYMKSRQHFW